MFLILPKTWITFFNWPKIDEGYWNSHMILVQEVTILPSGSVYFSVRGKKEWLNSLSKAFVVDGNTNTTTLKCKCSCIICPNVQNFCPKNGQFCIVGGETASPCHTLMHKSKRNAAGNCEKVVQPLRLRLRLQTRISHIGSTPEFSERTFLINYCDGLETTVASTSCSIRQAGAPETASKSATPCFYLRLVITRG